MAFEQQMIKDTTLKSAVDNYDIAKEISLGFLEEEVRNVLNEDVPIVSISTKPRRSWLNIAAAVIVLVGATHFLYVNYNSNKEHLQYASLHTDPAWPGERVDSNDSLSDAINIALDGNTLPAVRMIKQISISEFDKSYWIAEVFAKEAMSDSVLHYLPSPLTNEIQRDRINYLKIISLYNLKKYQQVKQEIDALPVDTDEWYIKFFNQLY